MRCVVRVVKRGEIEKAKSEQASVGDRAIKESTPEMIIKSWITASRERRRAQAADSLRDFRRWEQNLCPLES